jgi:hypothetical protein
MITAQEILEAQAEVARLEEEQLDRWREMGRLIEAHREAEEQYRISRGLADVARAELRDLEAQAKSEVP